MTSGFHNTGGRKVAGVAWVIRVFIANDRRGKAKHKTGTSRAMIRWTAANSVRRCPVSSVVDTRSINPSMSDSHRVAGVRWSGFQTCALPELSQKSAFKAGSVSVVSSRKYAASVLAAGYSLHQRADLEADHIHSHAHAREAVANDRGPALERGIALLREQREPNGSPASIFQQAVVIAVRKVQRREEALRGGDVVGRRRGVCVPLCVAG